MPIHGYPGNVITANPTAPTVSSASGVWTTEQQLQAMAAGNWPMAATQISRSLRFNSADSAYLSRTFASAGNRKTYTFSFWMKRSTLGRMNIFVPGDNSTFGGLSITSSNTVQINNRVGGTNAFLETTQVFRDVSSWYHLVWNVDTTQATASNRSSLYVNGVKVTAFGTEQYPSQNSDTNINNSIAYWIGRFWESGFEFPFDGYMTEVNFIDGQALTPSSFGQTNSSTGVWEPRQYTGPYGTNGFYVNFSDNSNTTAATLGKDYSGNGNNWTPNNFSVTAGVGNDSMVDSPTAYGTDTGAGGQVRGNYATLNPLDVRFGTTSVNTLSNGNLTATGPAAQGLSPSTISFTSGKWYFEATATTLSATTSAQYLAYRDSVGSAAYYAANGSVGGVSGSSGGSWSANDVIGLAVDKDAGTIEFFKNGTTQGGSRTLTANAAGNSYLQVSNYNGGVLNVNFGQRAFAYTAPSGFQALVTTNLPTPTIGATSTTQANDYFNPVLYTGDGTAIGSGGKTVTGVGFQSDFTWIKSRSSVLNHRLIDSVRGAPLELQSNLTDAEVNRTEGLNNWTSDGFVVGNASGYNANGTTFVAWNWNAGGSNATNTSGTITSTVRANTTSGFSIVTFTTAGANATIGHGLGVAPRMVIMKDRTNAASWLVYHASLASASNYLVLNATDASASNATVWNSTAPTSTVFSIGTVWAASNYVAYCFAPVAGYSAFGIYTGNGSNDGPFVYTGFRPRYVMIKRTDTGGAGFDWFIWDTARDTYNQMTSNLTADQNVAEGVTAYPLDALSNGFKVRNAGTAYNASGGTYIYFTFAENPFKYALAR